MTNFYYTFEFVDNTKQRLHFASQVEWDENLSRTLGDKEHDELVKLLAGSPAADGLVTVGPGIFEIPFGGVQSLSQFLRYQGIGVSATFATFINKFEGGETADVLPPVPSVAIEPRGIGITIGDQRVALPVSAGGMKPSDYHRLSVAFDAYARYLDAIDGLLEPALEKKVAPAPTSQSKSVSLLNGFTGEVVESDVGFVVYVKQNGVNLRKTKPCATREEAVSIALKFSRMIPGLCGADEIERC